MNGNAPSLATSIAFICITCYRKTSVRFDKLKASFEEMMTLQYFSVCKINNFM